MPARWDACSTVMAQTLPWASMPSTVFSSRSRVPDGPFDPIVANGRAIRAGAERLKVAGSLHLAKVSEPTVLLRLNVRISGQRQLANESAQSRSLLACQKTTCRIAGLPGAGRR